MEVVLEQEQPIPIAELDTNPPVEQGIGEEILPVVSVVVPTYNRPKYLLKAITSVLDQNYPNIEIIIVDNASNDKGKNNTKNTIKSLISKHPEIVVVTRETTIDSPSVLYNMGIDISTGSIVTFLDDDNLYDSFRIRAGVMGIIFGDNMAVWTGMDLFKEDEENFESEKITAIAKPTVLNTVATSNPLPVEYIHPNDLMVRRFVFDKVGFFDEALSSSVAMEFIIRLTRSGMKTQFVSAPVVHYRVWKDQRSNKEDYYANDQKYSRNYIRGKELTMRKDLKIYVVGGASDPYMVKALSHVDGITVKDLSHMASFVQEYVIMKELPNFVICPDLLEVSEPVLKMLYRLRSAVTIGLTNTKDKLEEIKDEKLARLFNVFPQIDWYITDHVDSVAKHKRLLLADPPKTEKDAIEFWENIIRDIRSNRYAT